MTRQEALTEIMAEMRATESFGRRLARRKRETIRVRVPICRVCDKPILGVVWRGPECVGCAIEGVRQAELVAEAFRVFDQRMSPGAESAPSGVGR
jgi:hypothetical protein